MRHFGFAALLSLLTVSANALELEESRSYPAKAATRAGDAWAL